MMMMIIIIIIIMITIIVNNNDNNNYNSLYPFSETLNTMNQQNDLGSKWAHTFKLLN